MIEDRLASLVNNEARRDFSNYSLDGIQEVLKKLGNPERNFRSVHIAGTNGKGSVAYMLQDIFIKSGYRPGLYTSPHLLRINERIKINGIEIADQKLEAILDYILDSTNHLDGLNLTYFDVLTVSAFVFFSQSRVDLAVIETGLGGRLDSTNVIIPECSIITDISLDHTFILGNSPGEIAREKGGIIKGNVPVITTNEDREIVEHIAEQAEEASAHLQVLNSDFRISDIKHAGKMKHTYLLSLSKNGSEEIPVELHDMVPVQVRNSAAAAAAAWILRVKYPGITVDAIREGIKNCRIPGRFERIFRRFPVYFDPGHNTSAIGSLLEFVRGNFQGPVTVIITLLKDKDFAGIMSTVSRFADRIIYHLPEKEPVYSNMENIEKYSQQVTVNEQSLTELLNTLDLSGGPTIFTGTFRLYKTALYCAEIIDK